MRDSFIRSRAGADPAASLPRRPSLIRCRARAHARGLSRKRTICPLSSRGLAGIGAGLLIALCAACLTLAPAATATGPGNPLSSGLPQAPSVTPTAPTTTTSAPVTTGSSQSSSSGGGFSGVDALAVAAGAIVVLGGISLFIWRDARRRAPMRHAAAATAGADGRSRGSKPRPKPRKPSPAERRRRKRGRAR